MTARLNSAITAVTNWWVQRAPRERKILRIGGVFLLPILLIFGIWLPLAEKLRKLEQQSATLEVQLLDLRGMQGALESLGKTSVGSADAAALSPDLPSRLTAELLALHPQVKGEVRATDSGLDVQIELAQFDLLLVWLDGLLQAEKLIPVDVSFAAAPTQGWVSGRVRLQAGAAQ